MEIEQQILCLAARLWRDPAQERQLLELLRKPVDWDRLWMQGYLHEVLSLLIASLRQLQHEVSVPAAWMERAQRRFYATLLHNTMLADELTRVLSAFQEAGIGVLPVKGIVLAETIYGNLALRPAADLDVLVRPSDLGAARSVLRVLGFIHPPKLTFVGSYHAFHDPQYFRQTARGQVCLELHWALWSSRFFHVNAEILWERAVITRLHGLQVSILSPEDTLLHLVIHRTRSPLRLRFLCDIAELLRCHSATLDWDYVLQQSNVIRARTALYLALSLAQQLLGAPVPANILPQIHISQLKQRLLDHIGGVTALFRPTQADDLSQQPHLTLRLFEQDGLVHIVRELGYTTVRVGHEHLFNIRQRLQPKKQISRAHDGSREAE